MHGSFSSIGVGGRSTEDGQNEAVQEMLNISWILEAFDPDLLLGDSL